MLGRFDNSDFHCGDDEEYIRAHCDIIPTWLLNDKRLYDYGDVTCLRIGDCPIDSFKSTLKDFVVYIVISPDFTKKLDEEWSVHNIFDLTNKKDKLLLFPLILEHNKHLKTKLTHCQTLCKVCFP